MRRFSFSLMLVAVAAVLTTGASAQESGLSSMHAQAPVGTRVCMTDHTHDGKGSGSTEAEARQSAARAWSSFTDWEYGGAWSSYSMANAKRERCEPEAGQISCYVVAYPCKSRDGRLAMAQPRATPAAKGQPRAATKAGASAKAAKAQRTLKTLRTQSTKKKQAAPVLRQAVWSDEDKRGTFASMR